MSPTSLLHLCHCYSCVTCVSIEPVSLLLLCHLCHYFTCVTITPVSPVPVLRIMSECDMHFNVLVSEEFAELSERAEKEICWLGRLTLCQLGLIPIFRGFSGVWEDLIIIMVCCGKNMVFCSVNYIYWNFLLISFFLFMKARKKQEKFTHSIIKFFIMYIQWFIL